MRRCIFAFLRYFAVKQSSLPVAPPQACNLYLQLIKLHVKCTMMHSNKRAFLVQACTSCRDLHIRFTFPLWLLSWLHPRLASKP